MKKNGFTLVELLAVIVIIGAVMTLAVLGVVNIINSNEDKVNKQQVNEVIEAAINYVNSLNKSLSVSTDGTGCEKVDLNTLKTNNFFEDNDNRCENITLSVCRNSYDELYVENSNSIVCKGD